MTLLPALAFGVVLGLRHATDADHVAAVAAMATRAHGESAWRTILVGVWWGTGHSISVLLVGGALVLLRSPMPDRMALALEVGVALMLIGLGLRSLVRPAGAQAQRLQSLLVGVMHGLAGSAVLALLLIGQTESAAAALIYLLCFCLGTIAGMSAVAALFTLPARMNPVRALQVERGLRFSAGIASVAIGVAMAHRVGVREGLFAATPVAP